MFETVEVLVGKFKVSVIKDDQYIGGCLRRGIEWDGWMRRDLPSLYVPGTEILDIGGNIGWNALMFSDYGPVHTFDPLFHSVIQKNVEQNNLLNPVTVHPYGLSDKEENLDIYVHTYTPEGMCNWGGSTLHKEPDGYKPDGISVPLKKLDDVYSGNVSFMKLDVESHELYVLRGAQKTIEKDKPSMYIEILDYHEEHDIVTFMKGMGYGIPLERPEHNYLFISPSRLSAPEA
jgi:FkbM family methyltransferase